jgi:hypothetical protein
VGWHRNRVTDIFSIVKTSRNIKIIKNRKRRVAVAVDPKKECIIKELAVLAEARGYAVKRENLKQGIGWKVMSGACRFNEDKLIYIDRKLPQSDQISFLFSKVVALGLKPDSEQLQNLSEDTRSMFAAVA